MNNSALLIHECAKKLQYERWYSYFEERTKCTIIRAGGKEFVSEFRAGKISEEAIWILQFLGEDNKELVIKYCPFCGGEL